MKKVLLTDLDDTLCNSSQAYEKALKKCYLSLHKHYSLLDWETFINHYLKAREQIHVELKGTASMHNRFLYFQRLFEILGLGLDPSLLDTITQIFWNEVYRNIKLYAGVKRTLRIAKENNIKVGVVTNLVAHVQINKLKKLGIAEYIDFIVSSEEVGKEKPHPSIYLLALHKAHAHPEEAIMVGDSLKDDVIGAKNVGIEGILIDRFDNTTNKDLTNVNVIRIYDEVLRFLNISNIKRTNNSMIIVDFLSIFGFDKKSFVKELSKKTGKSFEEIENILYNPYKDIPSQMLKYIIAILNKKLNKCEVKSGTRVLNELYKIKSVKISISSIFPPHIVEEFMKLIGIKEAKIYSAKELKIRKDDDNFYRYIVDNEKVKPQKCYLVDSTLEDLRSARYSLIKTIWLKQTNQHFVFIPDRIIKSFDEIKTLFK